jgi:hypothetical protein
LLTTARVCRSTSLASDRWALVDGVEVGWFSVGVSVGDEVGTSVVGLDVGSVVGESVGGRDILGDTVGTRVGLLVGSSEMEGL